MSRLNRPAALVIAGVVMLLGLGGCQTYSSPVLNVESAQPTERTADGVAMQFTLEATNQNDVALPLRDVRYSIELNGKQVFSGTRSAEATLRRLGTQQIFLPAAIPVGEEPGAAGSGSVHYKIAGTISYVTPGQIAEILFDAGVRVPTVDFSGEGDIDLSGAVVQPAPSPMVPPPAPAKAKTP